MWVFSNFLFMKKKEALYHNIKCMWKNTYFNTCINTHLFFLFKDFLAYFTPNPNTLQMPHAQCKFRCEKLGFLLKLGQSSTQAVSYTPSQGETDPALRCPQRNHPLFTQKWKDCTLRITAPTAIEACSEFRQPY